MGEMSWEICSFLSFFSSHKRASNVIVYVARIWKPFRIFFMTSTKTMFQIEWKCAMWTTKKKCFLFICCCLCQFYNPLPHHNAKITLPKMILSSFFPDARWDLQHFPFQLYGCWNIEKHSTSSSSSRAETFFFLLTFSLHIFICCFLHSKENV